MHFPERSLDAEIFFCSVGMGCHDSYNGRVVRIVTRRNDSENNVLTREDSCYTFPVHNQHGRGMIFTHEPCCFADSGTDIDEDRRRSRFDDGREIWTGHFHAEFREILEHLLGLRSCCAPFGLNAFQCFIKFL